MLSWRERHGIDYIVGIARNKRLNAWAKPLLRQAHDAFEQCGEKRRLFDEFFYSAKTWDRLRRVIVKAEHKICAQVKRHRTPYCQCGKPRSRRRQSSRPVAHHGNGAKPAESDRPDSPPICNLGFLNPDCRQIPCP